MNFYKYLKAQKRLDQKVVVITGANSGVGLALSELIITLGGIVIMANRDLIKSQVIVDKLKEKHKDAKIKLLYFDQANTLTIRDFVDELVALKQELYAFVFNAGVYYPDQHAKTNLGIPLTFGVNYVGNYYLTKLLKDQRAVSEKTRLVYITSPASKNRANKAMKPIFSDQSISRHIQYQTSKYAISTLALAMMQNYQAAPLFIKNNKNPIYLYHPGITNSRIARVNLKVIDFIVHGFMKLVFHAPKKAALCGLKALTIDETFKNEIIVPRGVLEVSGFPKVRKLNLVLLENAATLFALTEEALNQV